MVCPLAHAQAEFTNFADVAVSEPGRWVILAI